MDIWTIEVIWTGNEPDARYDYTSRELMIEHWNGFLKSPVVAMLILLKNDVFLTAHDVNKS